MFGGLLMEKNVFKACSRLNDIFEDIFSTPKTVNLGMQNTIFYIELCIVN